MSPRPTWLVPFATHTRRSRTKRRLGFDDLEVRSLLAATISGTVFQLIDANGFFPTAQMGGFLSTVGNVPVSLDGGAPVLSGASDGSYSFANVAPGSHTVAISLPSGFLGFSGQSLSYSLVIQANQTSYANLNFALTPKSAALVQNLYELVMSRPATADELKSQVAAAERGASPGSTFQSLLTSGEFQLNSQPIANFLGAVFPGRPLLIGLMRNAVQLQGLGVAQDATMLQVIYSRPFVAKYGDTSLLADPDYVRFLYRTLLLRNPTPTERANWVDGLRKGTINRGDVALTLVGTKEFLHKQPFAAPRVGVSLAYLGTLGREATPAELKSGVARVHSGESYERFANRLAASTEARNLKGYTDTFVWDVKAHQVPTATNDLARLQQYDPTTNAFDIAVTAGSITSSAASPTNLYVISHGWAPGFAEDVLLHSTPGNPLRWWQTPGLPDSQGDAASPWMFDGVAYVSSQGLAQAIVAKDPLAKVVAFSWLDQSATPQAFTPSKLGLVGKVRAGTAIVRGLDTGRLLPGMTISGPGIEPGSFIRSFGTEPGSIVLSRRATANVSAAVLTVDLARFAVAGRLAPGSPVVRGIDTSYLVSGMTVSGPGIAVGTAVKSIDSPSQLTLTSSATTAGKPMLVFTGTNLVVISQRGTTTTGSKTLTGLDTSQLSLGLTVVGPGLAPGTTIANIDGPTQVTLNQAATGSYTSPVVIKGTDLDSTLKQLLYVGQSEANTQVNGLRMASAIEKALAPGFFSFGSSSGAGLIHLLGHSHGAKVATVATLALRQAGVPVAQLTTLESPEAGPTIGTSVLNVATHLANLGGAENFLWYYLRQMKLGRSSVGASRTSTDSTFVDNYYSQEGVGTALGSLDLSQFDPSALPLSSILDVQLHPELLYGALGLSDLGGIQQTLLGSHDYPPPFYGQSGLQGPSSPQVGINWSPLLGPANVPTTQAFAQPSTLRRSGTLTNGSTLVTGVDVSGLAVGMPVADSAAFFKDISDGTTIAAIDASAGTITLSQPATGSKAATLVFTFTKTQYITNPFNLESLSLTKTTPAAPVPLSYARQYAMGSVTDTGQSLALTVGPGAGVAVAAITFNPEPGPGFNGLGSGMDLQVKFDGAQAGDDVQLVVWMRGIASAPRVLDISGQGAGKLTTGSTIGSLSIPLFTMSASAAGTTTQSATLSMGGLLDSFFLDAPFNALNGGSPTTVIPALGFSVVGNPDRPVTVTVSGMRQFEDGIR